MTSEWLRAAASLRSPVSTMQALIGMAMETGSWSGGTVTIREPNDLLRTFAYLDNRAADCDRLQQQTGEGPAHDAVHLDPLQAATNLSHDPRWPRWSPAVLHLGIHRTLTLRLFTNQTWGTLNLYATSPGNIDRTTTQNVDVIAAHTSVLLAALITEDQLRHAVGTRELIGQAQGILMHKYRIDAKTAFAVLRRTSQQQNIRVADIAEHLVVEGTLPGLTAQGTSPGQFTPRPNTTRIKQAGLFQYGACSRDLPLPP